MAERVDAIPIDVRHGAGGAELEIAGEQAHTHRVTGTQRTIVAGGEAGAGRLSARHRHEAGSGERRRERIDHRRVEAGRNHRHRDRTQHRADAAEIGGAARDDQRLRRLIDERAGAAEVAGPDVEQLARRRRPRHGNRARAPRRGRHHRRVEHFRDRRNARDGLGRELTERIRHRAHQPAIDVNRAAAHAGDDAGLGQRTAFEPGENQAALRTDHVPHHSKHVDLEVLELGAGKHGTADAHHAGPDLVQRQHGRLGMWCRQQDTHRQERGGKDS